MENKKDFRSGHRGRVKDRFFREGLSHFVDYEVLELLLFFVIPRRDTKEMAHALIHRFSSLNGVLHASEEQLCLVAGIGNRTAAYLRALLPFAECAIRVCEADADTDEETRLVSAFMRYFSTHGEARVLAAYMNNRMEILALEDLGVERFTCVSVSARSLVSTAFCCEATHVALAYRVNRTFPFPTLDAMDATRDIEYELAGVDLKLVDNFVIADRGAASVKKAADGEVPKNIVSDKRLFQAVREAEKNDFSTFLSTFMSAERAKEIAEILLADKSLRKLFSLPYKKLAEEYPEQTQTLFFLQVLGSLLAYVHTERYRLTHPVISTAKEMGEMFCAVMRGRRSEVFCLATFDKTKRLIGIRFIGEGTVNAAYVASRTLTEEAVARGAASVALAHNHPFGDVTPSSHDVRVTSDTVDAFRAIGIKFLEHFVVNENEYTAIAHDCMHIFTDADEDFY